METSFENLSDNGKDIVMPVVSVSIPIFTKKYKSQTKNLKQSKDAETRRLEV